MEQALARLPKRIVSLGPVTSVVVNYSPDYADEFDPEGQQIRELDRAYRLAPSSFHIGR